MVCLCVQCVTLRSKERHFDLAIGTLFPSSRDIAAVQFKISAASVQFELGCEVVLSAAGSRLTLNFASIHSSRQNLLFPFPFSPFAFDHSHGQLFTSIYGATYEMEVGVGGEQCDARRLLSAERTPSTRPTTLHFSLGSVALRVTGRRAAGRYGSRKPRRIIAAQAALAPRPSSPPQSMSAPS